MSVEDEIEGIDLDSITLLQMEEPAKGSEIAVVETTAGDITILLYPEEAPQTVAYFKSLVEEGFFNNKPLFRQEDVDAIVGGASNEYGNEGKVPEEGLLPPEITPNLWHFSGAVSALGVEKESWISDQMKSGSRFFVLGNIAYTEDTVEQMKANGYPDKIIDAYRQMGGLVQYTGKCTVFGQVIDGLEVVDELIQVAINEENNQLADGSVIQKITLGKYSPAE